MGGPRSAGRRERLRVPVRGLLSLPLRFRAELSALDRVGGRGRADVFLRIWEQRATWEPTTGVRAYLFAACRNQALGILKHERVVVRTATRATREELALGMGRGAPAPDAALHATELANALRDAVHALPERRRMVVVLR